MTPTMTQTAETHMLPATAPNASSALADQVAGCIRRHIAGDGEAMTDLTRHVTGWLYHVVRCFRLQQSTTDDVVQSTLLVALLHLHELRDPGSGLSWLTVVARREALRVINMERRYVCVDDVDSLHAVPASCAGPEEIVLDDVYRAAIRRTIAKLPNRHRVLLEQLIHADQPSYAAISAALKVPVGSIGPTRRRGIERMRLLLAADPEWDWEIPA
jgi:RNA polymerase sigma factor (sigma-70 family)